jgi:hypothetical protein
LAPGSPHLEELIAKISRRRSVIEEEAFGEDRYGFWRRCRAGRYRSSRRGYRVLEAEQSATPSDSECHVAAGSCSYRQSLYRSFSKAITEVRRAHTAMQAVGVRPAQTDDRDLVSSQRATTMLAFSRRSARSRSKVESTQSDPRGRHPSCPRHAKWLGVSFLGAGHAERVGAGALESPS